MEVVDEMNTKEKILGVKASVMGYYEGNTLLRLSEIDISNTHTLFPLKSFW